MLAQQHQQRLKGWPADVSMQPGQMAQHHARLRQARYVLASLCLAFHELQHMPCSRVTGCALASDLTGFTYGSQSHPGDGRALQGGRACCCRHCSAGCRPPAGATPAALRVWRTEGLCLARTAFRDRSQHRHQTQMSSSSCCLKTETRVLTWEAMARREAVHAAVIVQQVGGPQQGQRQPR